MLGSLIWWFDFNYYLVTLANAGLPGLLGSTLIFYVGVIWIQTLLYGLALIPCRDDLKLPQLLRNGAIIALRYPLHNAIFTIFIGLLFLPGVLFSLLSHCSLSHL